MNAIELLETPPRNNGARDGTDLQATLRIKIEGTLDASSAPALKRAIDRLSTEPGTDVTVDLGSLQLIDSHGVRALVSLYKRVRAQGGHMHVVGLTNQPLAILRLLRLEPLFVRNSVTP